MKKHSRVAFVFLILFLFSISLAQGKNGILRGRVSDKSNGEVLAFANVYVKELKSGTTTDINGYFLLQGLPSNKKLTVVISYLGYKEEEIRVKLISGKVVHLNIELSPAGIRLQTIEKIGHRVSKSNATDIGLQRLSIREIKQMPRGVEADVFRSLQYSAGVQVTGDMSVKYYVRGSSGDQNLILLNGITLYNPFHALGIFSAIDPEIINNMEFFKGGFTAEFGGRLASVLNIKTLDGNSKRYSIAVGGSYLTAKGLLQGPFIGGTAIFSFRKSTETKILEKFTNGKSLPIDFYDYSFKVNYSDIFGVSGSKISLFGFFSKDNLKYSDPLRESYFWKNNCFGVEWLQLGDSPLFFKMNLSYSNFEAALNPGLSKIKPKSNAVTDITVDSKFIYVYSSKNELSIGIKIKDVKTDLYLQNGNGVVTDLGLNGTSISVYSKFKLLSNENFGLDLGLRANLTRMQKRSESGNILEPRISLTYKIFPTMKIKGAWGIYQQEMATVENENDIISLFEPWVIIPSNIPIASSRHFIGGIEWNITEKWQLISEAYFKKTINIAANNYKKILPSDPDFVPGELEAYGFENKLQYVDNIFNFSASYTFSNVYKTVDNWVYYPGYDSRHMINSNLDVNVGKGWNVSLFFIYRSGLPFTKTSGYFNKLDFISPFFDNRNLMLSKFPLLQDRNSSRLPDYHRLDFNLTKKIDFKHLKMEMSFSVLNIYNRKNIFYFEKKTGNRVNMLPLLLTGTLKVRYEF